MVVLGLLLLIGAGVFAAAVITSNTGAVGGDLWGLHISNASLGTVYVAGMLTSLVALVALVVLLAGMRRGRRLRQERRTLAKENARLSQSLSSGPGPDAATWTAAETTHGAADGPPAGAEVPVDNRSVRPPADTLPRYDSPPPPAYDRATIEADAGHRAAEDSHARIPRARDAAADDVRDVPAHDVSIPDTATRDATTADAARETGTTVPADVPVTRRR